MSVGQNATKELTLDELKETQMNILSAIDEFCDKQGIRYSMACGTLLGAVRHKGYIPWDDDIDIYMPREDYIKMMEEFPNTYKGKYKIASLERDTLWDRPFAKAYDDTTLLIENDIVKEAIGVNIDIFPIDEIPDNDKEWETYNKWRKFKLNILKTKFNSLKSNQSFRKKIGICIIRGLTWWYSKRQLALNFSKLAQKNNGKGYSRCFECCFGLGLFQDNPFPKSLFGDIVKIPFENRKFNAFANADKYLRYYFGNYMTLPPMDKRVPHHDFKAYWK